MSGQTKRFLLSVAFLIAITLGLAFQFPRAFRGENDFGGLFSGAQLAGTGQLFDRAANVRQQEKNFGLSLEANAFTRPPFYGVILHTLTLLPFRAAYAVYSSLSLGAIIWFLWRFQGDLPQLAVLVPLSIPVIGALLIGQDTLFLVALTGGSLVAHRAGRHYLAGGVLMLCAFKFHLFGLVPLALLVRREWRTLAGGAACGVALLAVGTWAGSLHDWFALLRDPNINFSALLSPNIHGLVSYLNGGLVVEAVLTLLVTAAVIYAATVVDTEAAFALALIGSGLISYHSAIPDSALYLPAAAILVPRMRNSAAIAVMWFLLLSPIAATAFSASYWALAIPTLVALFYYAWGSKRVLLVDFATLDVAEVLPGGYDSRETALVADQQRLGFGRRGRVRYWLEYREGLGYRMGSQRARGNEWSAPVRTAWAPLASLYKDSRGRVRWTPLTVFDLDQLDVFARRFARALEGERERNVFARLNAMR